MFQSYLTVLGIATVVMAIFGVLMVVVQSINERRATEIIFRDLPPGTDVFERISKVSRQRELLPHEIDYIKWLLENDRAIWNLVFIVTGVLVAVLGFQLTVAQAITHALTQLGPGS